MAIFAELRAIALAATLEVIGPNIEFATDRLTPAMFMVPPFSDGIFRA